jgi:hypothetical protein
VRPKSSAKASNDVALFRRSGSFPVPWKSGEFGQLFQDTGGVSRHSPTDRDKFDDVDTPLAALLFGYE